MHEWNLIEPFRYFEAPNVTRVTQFANTIRKHHARKFSQKLFKLLKDRHIIPHNSEFRTPSYLQQPALRADTL